MENDALAAALLQPIYISPKQAAMICPLSEKTIRNLALAKKFRSVRFNGSKVFIDRTSFVKWLESIEE